MTAPGDGEGPLSGWFRPDDPADPASSGTRASDVPATPVPADPAAVRSAATPGDAPRAATPPVVPPNLALPPELSPRGTGPGTPAAALAKPARRRRHPILRGLVAATAAFVVIGSGSAYALKDHYLSKVNQIDVFDEADPSRPEKLDVPAENILVAGVDDRGAKGLTRKEKRDLNLGFADYGKRSDTMMLLHISDKTKSISAVSFPRDSLVTIPAYTDDDGDRRPASRNKLNAAYAFGGAALTVKTIEKATGVRIDHYVEVDIPGFIRMVDAVGGVNVCVPEDVFDQDSGLDLDAGTTKLNGAQGLAFVRARHIYADQDLGRIRAQQRFIGSMVTKATSPGVLLNPLKLNRVLNATLESITTSMSRDQIVEHANRIQNYKPSDIRFFTVPISNANYRDPVVGSTVLWDKTDSATLFDRIKRDEPLTKPATEKVTVAPGSITLQVLNGAGIQGLGGTAADDLAELGFGMAGPAANADVTDQTGTVVRYGPKKAEAAKTVLAALPGSTGVEVAELKGTLEVVIGSDYTENGVAKVTVAGTGKTPPPTAAEVGRSADEDICAGA